MAAGAAGGQGVTLCLCPSRCRQEAPPSSHRWSLCSAAAAPAAPRRLSTLYHRHKPGPRPSQAWVCGRLRNHCMNTAAGRLLLGRGLGVCRPPRRTNDIYCASGDGLRLRRREWGWERGVGRCPGAQVLRVIFGDIFAREPKGTQGVVAELSC